MMHVHLCVNILKDNNIEGRIDIIFLCDILIIVYDGK